VYRTHTAGITGERLASIIEYYNPSLCSESRVSVLERTLSLQARTKVESVCMPWGYSCRTVIQRSARCISTAIVKAVERCFSLISEGDKELELSMLISAG
jgi:hypothetical protein